MGQAFSEEPVSQVFSISKARKAAHQNRFATLEASDEHLKRLDTKNRGT